MNILFVTDNFPPERNAPSSRTYEHCLEWVKLGAKVKVITCAPNFPLGKVYEGYKNRLYTKENVEGIEVIRVWTYMAANQGFIRRVLDHLSFSFSAFWAGLFVKADIIIATSPQFFTCWSGWALSKCKRTPWVFELRDLWPESIKAVDAMQQGWVINVLEKIELALYRDADMVVAVTHSFKENLVSRGIDTDKIEVVTNAVNTTLFAPIEKDAALLHDLNLEGKFVVGYIGTHGMAHGLNFIIESIADITDPNVHFLFIGDGAMKKFITAHSRQLNLSNITFLDGVSRDDVPRYMSIIDTALVPLKKSDTFKMVIPSKIFEACAMQKPILLGVDGEAREIIESAGAGLYFEPENKVDFLEKIHLIKADNALYKELQLGCQTLTHAYSRNNLAKYMFSLLEQAFMK